jgi:hypothetical protein
MNEEALKDAERELGTDLLYRINTLIGSGMLFGDIIDRLASVKEITTHDLGVARSWWARQLPTGPMRLLARRLPLLLSSDFIRFARAKTSVLEANERFRPYIRMFAGNILPPITGPELDDLRAIVNSTGYTTPVLTNPWACLVFYALHYHGQHKTVPESLDHACQRFQFWLAREVGSLKLSYEPHYKTFFVQYIRWLEHHNPLDQRKRN